MTEGTNYSKVILEHYRAEAAVHGKDTSSTMRDEIIRGREVAAVLRLVDLLTDGGTQRAEVADIGCGNGYLLSVLRDKWPLLALSGVEYTPEMVEVAKARGVRDCQIVQGDVRALGTATASQDIVITERCIINVLDVEDQARSLREVARVLKPGGHFICIEAFADGLANLNEARTELGLEPNKPPHHNIWFNKEWFLREIAGDFEVVDLDSAADPSLPSPNFLSSHYFISRALYPAVTKREVLYNTHLVKFFSFLPPMGNYAPVQLYLLRRRG